MVSSAHTVVVCVVRRRRGVALVNTGPRKLFSSRVHSGCVCPHSGYVCFLWRETPYKHGVLESCFPVGFYRGIDAHSGFVCSPLESCFPVAFYRGIDRHSGFVSSHSGCLCCEKEEGGVPGNHGALKVVFQ